MPTVTQAGRARTDAERQRRTLRDLRWYTNSASDAYRPDRGPGTLAEKARWVSAIPLRNRSRTSAAPVRSPVPATASSSAAIRETSWAPKVPLLPLSLCAARPTTTGVSHLIPPASSGPAPVAAEPTGPSSR